MDLLEPARRLKGELDVGVEEQVEVVELALGKRELGKLQDDAAFLLLFDEAFHNPSRLILGGPHALGADATR
jgi:hypothetical protein